jgi:hypothetical protein
MENEKMENEKMENIEEIKVLKFGKGPKEKDLSGLKSIKKDAKTVKSKKKINAKLKRQLLKNYGFFVEDN